MPDERVPIVVLRDRLRAHVETEGKILKEYVKATNSTKSKALRYLVDLIIEDENQHHQIFRDLASTLEYAIDLVSPATAVPALDFERVDDAGTFELIDQLLRFEKEDNRELEELQREFRSFMDNMPLFGLLTELMQRDTDKHIAILRFAKKHMRRHSENWPGLSEQKSELDK